MQIDISQGISTNSKREINTSRLDTLRPKMKTIKLLKSEKKI